MQKGYVCMCVCVCVRDYPNVRFFGGLGGGETMNM